MAADFGIDVSGSDESTLLQAICSLEQGDEEEAVQPAERGGSTPKPLRRSLRKADGSGGAAAGGSSSKHAPQQTFLEPPGKQQKVADCWICKRPLTTTDPEDDTACARPDCTTGINSGAMDEGEKD